MADSGLRQLLLLTFFQTIMDGNPVDIDGDGVPGPGDIRRIWLNPEEAQEKLQDIELRPQNPEHSVMSMIEILIDAAKGKNYTKDLLQNESMDTKISALTAYLSILTKTSITDKKALAIRSFFQLAKKKDASILKASREDNYRTVVKLWQKS